jgi:DNA-binding phage protein
MAKILALTGMIHSKFRSESEMARKIGWSRQRLYKITNGTKEPNLDEVRKLAGALEMPVIEVAQFFLQKESPNGDN